MDMYTGRRAFVVALLIVFAAVAASAQSPTQPRSDSASLDGFHVVLLLAKGAPGAVPTDLPAGVAKALREAAELLPFKSYQVQDQAVLRSNGNSFQRVHLLGPLSRDYELGLETRQQEPQKVSIAVNLTYTAPDVKTFANVLQTEFSARLGETVVVGTSKVKGDESLVLLITPLAPKPKTADLAAKDTREVLSLRCEVIKDSKLVADMALHIRAGESGTIGVGNLKAKLGAVRLDAHNVRVAIEARSEAATASASTVLVDNDETSTPLSVGGVPYVLKIALLK
jgi:hypothetical protein